MNNIKDWLKSIAPAMGMKPDDVEIWWNHNIDPPRPLPSPTPTMISPLARTTSTPTPTPIPTNIPTAFQARNPNISKYKIEPAIHSAFSQASSKYDLPTSILYDIALQESSFNPNLTNTTPEGVKAGNPKGLFQFTDGTWKTVKNYANMPNSSLKLPNDNRFDPLTNAFAAAYLIKNGQLGRWDASKNVWGKYYKDEELKPYYSQTLNRQ